MRPVLRLALSTLCAERLRGERRPRERRVSARIFRLFICGCVGLVVVAYELELGIEVCL